MVEVAYFLPRKGMVAMNETDRPATMTKYTNPL
jgi:hypothetical protein